MEPTEKTIQEMNRAKSEIPPQVKILYEEYLSNLTEPVSKNEKKRKLKELIHESKKDEFLQQRRDRRKKAAENRKLNGIKRPKIRPQDKMGIHVVLDLEFSDKMTPKELMSTASQCQHTYSSCRKQKIGTSLYLTSLNDDFREYLSKKCVGYESWKVQMSPLHFMDYINGITDEKPTNICYLTADSENIIENINEDTYYVIGALVDRNRYPNLCLDKAKELGISHGKLPLAKFITFPTRKVLTINQVVAILAIYVNTGSWEQAILESIPARKQPTLITNENTE